MKSKRAFTLAELAVVIAVSGIAMAMLSVVMVQAHAFVFARQAQSARQLEISLFKKTFEGALEQFQSPTFQIVEPFQPSALSFWSSTLGTQTFWFQDGSLWLDQQKLETFARISSAKFETQNALIKCSLGFENATQTLVFVKRI